MDLVVPNAVDAAIREMQSAWGRVDVLINNAMYEQGRYTNAWIKDTPRAEWETTLPMNPNWSPTAILDWWERRRR